MIFEIFYKNSHYQIDNLQKNRENHLQGELVKIWEFTLGTIFIFPQKWPIIGSKLKFLNFLEFSLY